LVGPKEDQKEGQAAVRGVRYHARERMNPGGNSVWQFEEIEAIMLPTQMILVRIVLAKVLNTDKLAQLLRQIPIRQGEEGWNCVSWVEEALLHVENSKGIVGTSVVDWKIVRDTAMSYCQRKRDEHRFDGSVEFRRDRVPTFDLTQKKETIE
jgi:hypothetical protein